MFFGFSLLMAISRVRKIPCRFSASKSQKASGQFGETLNFHQTPCDVPNDKLRAAFVLRARSSPFHPPLPSTYQSLSLEACTPSAKPPESPAAMASGACAFCALSPSPLLSTPSRALGQTTPPASPQWRHWVPGCFVGSLCLRARQRPWSRRGYRALSSENSEVQGPQGPDSGSVSQAPKASGIPADSDGKRGKTPRNRCRVVFFCVVWFLADHGGI